MTGHVTRSCDYHAMCALQLLWSMLVEDSDLSGHLKLMKDFYLLGRGELFLAFIDLSHHFMKAPTTATTQHGELRQ